MNDGAIFVRNVLLILKRRNYIIGAVEDRIGCSRGYLSKCSGGKKKLSLDKALELSNLLKMNIYEIINLDYKQMRIEELKEEIRNLEEEK